MSHKLAAIDDDELASLCRIVEILTGSQPDVRKFVGWNLPPSAGRSQWLRPTRGVRVQSWLIRVLPLSPVQIRDRSTSISLSFDRGSELVGVTKRDIRPLRPRLAES